MKIYSELREKKYSELYENFKGMKYKLDTTKKDIGTAVGEFLSKII